MGLQCLKVVVDWLVIVAASSMAIVHCCEAADLYCVQKRYAGEKCRIVLIKGAIEQGDSAKFVEALKANHPFVDMVDLWSSGGSVEEAIKIGRLIRTNLIETAAPVDYSDKPVGRGWYFRGELVPGCPEINRRTPPKGVGCQCASACFLIWAAGIERHGSSLGLHRPTITSTSFATMPPDRASLMYRGLLVDINKYLSEMEISPRFAEFMIDTSSKDIRWLTWDEAETLEEVPSIHEWVATNCGAMSKNETTTWLMLGAEVDQFNKILSPRDRMLYEQLDNRWRKISSCRSTKIQQARDAIPKPH
jgi:hypothetical protein